MAKTTKCWRVFDRLRRMVGWRDHRRNRKAAEKFGYDFEHRCVFDSQLSNYTRFPKDGRIIEVKMQSGKIALYKMIRVWRSSLGDTGQKHWKFEFQKYKPNENNEFRRNNQGETE